jgi:hypothetical protein
MIRAMKVMLDAQKDIAYVLLDDELRANYDGWSMIFLPPEVPTPSTCSGTPTTG